MPSLTLLLSSGSPLHPDERRAIRERITPHFYETYATTEGGGVSLLTPDDQIRRGDSVGRAMFGVELQVVDADDAPVELGKTGILRYRSPGCATRFYGETADAPQMFRHGWFYPGDLGALDEEGYLFLKGRIKEMIIRGGVNIYPNEIEAILLAHPAIAEAAVVAQPSREMGEEVAAFVIARASVAEADLIAHCRAQLAPYKVPRTIRIVDALPKSSLGKILKPALVKLLPEL
jgi:acyl-coenzyme A synthetase/AMP-(fatty) acid ligase